MTPSPFSSEKCTGESSPGIWCLRWAAPAAAMLLMLEAAMGQTINYYWSGNGANSNFTTLGNFKNAVTGDVNSTPAADDKAVLIFGARAAAQTTANNPANPFQLNGITFESATDAAGVNFQITGSQISFAKKGAVNPVITQNSARDHTISAPITLAAPTTLGGSGAGVVTLSGGLTGGGRALTKSGTSVYVIAGSGTGLGAASVQAGVLQIGNGGASGSLISSSLTLSSGAVFRINQSDTVTQGTDFTSASISGAGTLEQSGSGTTVLNAANAYTGGTVVNAGTLLATNSTGSATGTGSVTVKNAATLGGTGTISGNTVVESGGSIRAGTAAGDYGTLNLSGGLTMNSGSTWLVDLAQGGTSVDKVAVTGTLSLDGALSIVGQGTYVTNGTSYRIASYSTLGGRFSNDLISNSGNLLRYGRIDAGGGQYWQVDYLDAGNITLTAVPESGMVAPLLAVGALGFFLQRRRRHRAAKERAQ